MAKVYVTVEYENDSVARFWIYPDDTLKDVEHYIRRQRSWFGSTEKMIFKHRGTIVLDLQKVVTSTTSNITLKAESIPCWKPLECNMCKKSDVPLLSNRDSMEDIACALCAEKITQMANEYN